MADDFNKESKKKHSDAKKFVKATKKYKHEQEVRKVKE